MSEMLKHLQRGMLLMYLLCLAATTQAVKNIEDRLSTPAKQTPFPAQMLLIDVQNTGSRIVAVGGRGVIIYSDDKGRSWEQATVPVSVTLVALHFVNDKTGWAVGHSGVVLRSDDRGETWRKQFDGVQANALVVKQAEQELEALRQQFENAESSELDDLRYAIEDAEFALEDARLDAEMGAGKPMLDVWFRNEQEGYVVGAYGYFFATKDGGSSWQNYASRLENFDRFHLNALGSVKGGAMMIVGEAGQMFASYDNGSSWETLYSPYGGSFFGVQGTAKEGEVLVFGLRGHVFRSSDAGQSWEQVYVPTEATLNNGIRTGSSGVVLVGQSGTVLLSSDSGMNFTKREASHLDAYTAVATTEAGGLLLVGEKGVRLAQN